MAAPSMCEENLVTDGVVCETRPKVIKATYTRIVHDFSLRREQTGQAISASDHDGIQWCMVLYPNGESERCKDYVSVFLRRMFSNCSSFLAQYEIAVLGEERHKVFAVRAPPSRFAFGSACGGFHSFIKRDRLLKGTEHLLPNDRLTIRCEVLAFVDSVKILPAVNVPIHEMTERKEGRVEVTDCDFKVLREVVEYIYTGRARKLHKMAEKVLVAADKYDLSRLKAMCESVLHGIATEPLAAQRYEEVLNNLNHGVALGASPDRIVFDPVEGSYGVLEIKCPRTLRDLKASQLAAADFCCEMDEDKPKLKRDHPYYYQLLGQMGVSGLTWGDFVVYGFDFILIERVRFDQGKWENTRDILDDFYFGTLLLPYLHST
ncbi:protein roadkill-like [Haemaphysalis longicornis]